MAKRPQQLLVSSGGDAERDQELATPTSQSHSDGWHSQANSDSFTGWPWSVRHDYQQLRVAGSSNLSQVSHPSRTASWDNDEELLLGRSGLGAGGPRRLHHALGVVIVLNALAMAVEAILISQEEVKRIMELFEVALTAAFMVLILRVVRSEVASFGEAFRAKQVVAEGERKEEMMCAIRAHVADLQEAVLNKSTFFEKDIGKRFSKCDAAIAIAKAEATAMRRQLEAAQAEAEEMRVAADDIGARLADLESAFAASMEGVNEHASPNGAEQIEEPHTTLMAALKEKVFGGGITLQPPAAPAPAAVAQGGEPDGGGDGTPTRQHAAEPLMDASVAGHGQAPDDAGGEAP